FTWYLFTVARINAYVVYDIFNVVELAFFLVLFKQIFKTKKVVKYLPFLFVGFIIFIIIDYAFHMNTGAFDSKSSGIESIIIITLCLYYFYEELKQANSLLIYTTINFWIIIAFLIYLSGTFFLFLFAENTLHDKVFQIQYIVINSSFIIIKNIFFSIALMIKSDSSQPPNFPNENPMSDWDNIQSLKM
ncbi:MAG: hypothetical protein ABIN97_00960, partial [Ginsengibacter sp.]